MIPIKRCAIYTRKSSEEGLEQEFNSLHAQREACESYIKSQRHEGWQAVKDIYDDGGISGGTMERPALLRLMQDVREHKIDIVVVYKVDRLTRSLADFAKIVEVFDAKQVSFVSVTQQFNTTSSMGRLTLNVLLSFAQFEREVTGERIRDKVAASKKKGMWMGGFVPLGYDAIDKKLIINPQEATTVRKIFTKYLELGCVRLLQSELSKKGIRSKERDNNSKFGKGIISRGTLYKLLSNPIYIGQIRHKQERYEGLQEAILSQEIWDGVQLLLKSNAVKPSKPNRTTETSVLLGKLFDETGDPLTPSHANKQGRRYRYYVSRHLVSGNTAGNKDGWRLPAQELEKAVASSVRAILDDTIAVTTLLQVAGMPSFYIQSSLNNIAALQQEISQQSLPTILNRVTLQADGIEVSVSLASLVPHKAKNSNTLTIKRTVPIQMKRRGIEMRMVIGNWTTSKVDPILLKAIARAHKWYADWIAGESFAAIARRENSTKTYIRAVMKLVFLAPDIIEDIISGRQPTDLMADTLIKYSVLPLEWSSQQLIYKSNRNI